jgi:hypothetical protein
LHCGVQEEEETSNLAVQLHYGINETDIRQWKNQKEQLCMALRMMLCVMTVIMNCHSNELGHPGPRDGQ